MIGIKANHKEGLQMCSKSGTSAEVGCQKSQWPKHSCTRTWTSGYIFSPKLKLYICSGLHKITTQELTGPEQGKVEPQEYVWPKVRFGKLVAKHGAWEQFSYFSRKPNSRSPGNFCLWESNYYELLVKGTPTPKPSNKLMCLNPWSSSCWRCL